MRTAIVYWVCTVLLSTAYFAMGVSNYIQPGDMNVEIAKSGYPSHFFMVLGVWQVLAAMAISVPKVPRVKEWAYAGFTFDFIGAIIGFIATGNLVLPDIIMAPVGLMLCLATFYLWKKTIDTV